MSIFDRGDEWLKGSIHGAYLALAVLVFGYNRHVAWSPRGRWFHAANTWLAAVVIVAEIGNITRHALDGEE